METKLNVTHVQGQALLRYAAGARVPERLGDETFDLCQRALADDEMRRLRQTLRSYSPLLQAEHRLCFGEADNWRRDGEDGAQFRLLDPLREIEIRLDEEAATGAYWCLLLMAHPASPVAVNLTDLDEIVWPLAEKLGVRRQLTRDLKLDHRRGRRLVRDDSPEWRTASGEKGT